MSATEVDDSNHTRKRRTEHDDHYSSTNKSRKNENLNNHNDNAKEIREKLTPELRYQLDKVAFYVFMYGQKNEQRFIADITRFPDLARSLSNENSLIRDYYDDKKNTLTKTPDKYVPKYLHFSSFIYASIHPMISFKYKAAGIVPYCKFQDGRSCMLLGCEDRSKKEHGMEDMWCYFGGKRMQGENHPADTALRELREETAHIFSEEALSGIKSVLFSPYCAKVWFPAGKFVLFFVCIAYDETLPSKFLQNRFKPSSELSIDCDQTKIAWIPTKLIAHALATRSSTITMNGETLTLYRFFTEMLGGIYGVQNLLASDFSAF